MKQELLRKLPSSFTMSSMKINNPEAGFVSGTVLALIVVSVVLAGALGFGGWAFMSRQDYKNNSDQKAEAAADVRQQETEDADALRYAEEAKNPLTTHKAPDQYGGVTIQYPKTWSGYVVEGQSSGMPVNNFFHPAVVPDVTERKNAYALRVQVEDKTYDAVIKTFKNDIETNKLKATPYALPKVPDTVGTRFDGEVEKDKQGSLIVLPMRNMTLKVWTEAPGFLADFNNIILANLTFSP